MKIEGKPKGKATEGGKTAPAAATPEKKPAGAKPRSFLEKLRKKTEGETKSEETSMPLLTSPKEKQPPPLQAYQNPDTVTGAAAPARMMPIQGLVQEIQVRVETSGVSEVEIQFTSQTFDGLRVNIKKEDGGVMVRLSTTNEATSQLLAQQIPALTRALASKAIPAVVSIDTRGDSSGRDSSSGGGGGRQRKRK